MPPLVSSGGDEALSTCGVVEPPETTESVAEGVDCGAVDPSATGTPESVVEGVACGAVDPSATGTPVMPPLVSGGMDEALCTCGAAEPPAIRDPLAEGVDCGGVNPPEIGAPAIPPVVSSGGDDAVFTCGAKVSPATRDPAASGADCGTVKGGVAAGASETPPGDGAANGPPPCGAFD
jgi:hypothetical protein